MIERIQALPKWQRVLIFAGGVLAMTLLACAATYLVVYATANSTERRQANGMQDGVSVTEFITLPDDDSYPAAVAIDGTGTVYTGSYISGTIWHVSPDGRLDDIPATRDQIGSVSGLSTAPDDSLYILDILEPLRVTDSIIWQIAPDSDTPQQIATIASDDMLLPNDLALDAAGQIYVTDVASDSIWRFDPQTGDGSLWWSSDADPEQSPALTGIAYDAANDRLLATDSSLNLLYAIDVASAESQIIYTHDIASEYPAFDGLTVADDGAIYLAAPGMNRLAVLRDGDFTYLAQNFRSISDVACLTDDCTRLIATNWDQRALLPETFLYVLPVPISPHLPFALDLIDLNSTESD